MHMNARGLGEPPSSENGLQSIRRADFDQFPAVLAFGEGAIVLIVLSQFLHQLL